MALSIIVPVLVTIFQTGQALNPLCAAQEIPAVRCSFIFSCDHVNRPGLDVAFDTRLITEWLCCPYFPLAIIINIRAQFDASLTYTIPSGLVTEAESNLCPKSELLQFKIHAWAVKGISSNFSLPTYVSKHVSLLFKYSDLALTDPSGTRLNCSSYRSARGVFARPANSTLRVTFENGCRYHQDTCNELMADSNIHSFELFGVIESLALFNKPKWVDSRPAEVINSDIRKLLIDGYISKLDQGILAHSVFQSTKSLTFVGQIKEVEPPFLLDMALVEVRLFLADPIKFLHNNVNWLASANNRTTQSTLVVNLEVIFKAENIENPAFSDVSLPTRSSFFLNAEIKNYLTTKSFIDDTDFCMFYSIEQRLLNVALKGSLFDYSRLNRCSCTIAWIQMTFGRTFQDLEFYQSRPSCTQNLSECDFVQMKRRCQMPFKRLEYSSLYESVSKLKYASYIVSIYLTPFFSFIGLLANLVVVRTFRKIKRSAEYRTKKLTDKNRLMWDYVYSSSVLMALQALIFMLEPLGICIEYNGVYCSPLVFTRFVPVLYLFVQSLLGNSLRLMANMTNLMFVLYRYAVNVDCWKRLRKLKLRHFMLVALGSSFLISSLKLFYNEKYGIEVLSQDAFYYLNRRKLNIQFDDQTFQFVIIFNNLLVSIAFPLLTAVFDLRLLKFLRVQRSPTSRESAEAKVTQMVVLNALFSLFFRLPEIAITLFVINNARKNSIYCLGLDQLDSICHIVPQFSKFFYAASLTDNFITLFYFNVNFKKALTSAR
nr:G protein-coupled receptor [Proales similis]